VVGGGFGVVLMCVEELEKSKATTN